MKKNTMTAGGLVINKKSEILLIFRKNMWDLPKGKIENNESFKNAAVREVVEETGINRYLTIVEDKLISTPYKKFKKGEKIEKCVNWYLMKYYSNDLTLKPQIEENIQKAIWAPFVDLEKYYKNCRCYVKQVLEEYLSKTIN